jgi:hypothetical protein
LFCLSALVVIVDRVHVRTARRDSNIGPWASTGDSPAAVGEAVGASGGKERQLAQSPPKFDLQRVQRPQVPEEFVSPAVSGRVEFLDAAIKSQGTDSRWAKQMMTAIVAGYAGLEGTIVNSLECGKSLCRLQIDIASGDLGDGVKEGFARSGIASGERSLALTAPPMPPMAVIYFARDKMPLPSQPIAAIPPNLLQN